MSRKAHWEAVHAENAAEDVSWYTREPRVSLSLIEATGLGKDARVVDVGCGASGLPEHLLARGFVNVTALDVSSAALKHAKARVGADAGKVAWVERDVLDFAPEAPLDLWHDRAVFHFLVDPTDQQRYVEVAARALRRGGHLIVATFARDGPEKCSGLPVQRQDAASLARTLGARFRLVVERREDHVTPWDTVQRFQWARFERKP